MLAGVYELGKEVELFLEGKGNQNLLHLFVADGFQLTLAYLVDVFQALNLHSSYLHLQGGHISRINHFDSIRTFIEKLELWFRRIQRGKRYVFL